MVRASPPAESPESVKTPHRIELCEDQTAPPKRNYSKRRIITTAEPITENIESKPMRRKNGLRSKTLKNYNGCSTITTNSLTKRRAVRTASAGTDSHKLTEYFNKDNIKCEKLESELSVIEDTKTVKVEAIKVENGSPNHKLTEYFPVRRSVRKTSKCVMAEKMRDLERAIREQKEDGLAIALFEGKGRSIIATRHFSRGQYVVEYSGELVGTAEVREREAKYALDPNAGCYMYYFKLGEQQYCIDATAESSRLGRLVNHSRGGNLLTKAVWVDGPRLVLLAGQDIQPGQEICYDYGDRSRESLRHHPWLAL